MDEDSKYKKVNAAYYAKPISEGRMRSQEKKCFTAPESNPQRLNQRNLKSITGSGNNTKTDMKATQLNPFEDDNLIEYDESKNPFADDSPDAAYLVDGSSSEKQTKNPSGEYNSRLNPFE